ncbi:alpha/beta fold hydrolase [Streptomyces sp. NPDC093065]|uniref:alpha/beta fold hydrolase n=1 Tax=Streptomyces sp. NPDC093065 TaxID=3366021 RepID=UPI00382C5BAE
MLAYETRGSGPGLLLLHGTSSTGTGSWGTLLDALAAGHTVVAPDLPGSGNSPLPVGPLDLDTVADQARVCQTSGVTRVVGVTGGPPSGGRRR